MSSNKKVWDFQVQLEFGNRSEELFAERYPRKLEIYPGREYDFTVKCNGQKLELKTDSYNLTKTENFFLERYSDVHKKTPGGPWRAAGDKVDIFCYYFVRHNTWFEFRDLPKLIKRLDELTANKGLVHIKNRGWITGGYKVPRSALEDLFDVYEF